MDNTREGHTHLDAASVPPPALKQRMIGVPHLLERVERPAAPLAHQSQDRAEVVRHDDPREPPAVDEPRDLEDVLVLRRALLGSELV